MATRREFLQSSALIALVAPEADRLETQNPARPTNKPTREELVSVRTEDGLVMTGLQVTPDRPASRPLAVIWIHGAGANFYLPSYVNIARATASLGYLFITANTRMHDIGSVLAYQPAQVRGGTYWGLPSKEPLDIAGGWLMRPIAAIGTLCSLDTVQEGLPCAVIWPSAVMRESWAW
jgi:hypothetical protein